LVGGGFGALMLLLAGCPDKSATPAGGRGGAGGPAPVVVAKTQKKIVPLTLDAIGAVEPSRTAAIRSLVTGTLMKIHFQEGQDVEQGDLLFEIDPRPFQNAVQSAEADLQKTRVQLETAQTQVERYKSLNAESAISKEQYQSLLDSERVLSAQLASSDAAYANARLQLEYCSIRAPLPGRTGALGAHEGDLVRASDANISLVTIHQLSPIYVTFSVPQQYLAPLTRYQAAGNIAVLAMPPGEENAEREKGALIFIDNNVDSTTGTLKLKATFPNAAHRLWPGQFVTTRLTLAAPEVLVVPFAAIQNDQKGQHVFVIKDDHTAEFRTVTVERSNETDAVISKGLSEGETVVTDGQLRVIPGKPVEIKSSATEPADAKPRGKKQAT
jgi:multidrug efflux system membrane fusion protein